MKHKIYIVALMLVCSLSVVACIPPSPTSTPTATVEPTPTNIPTTSEQLVTLAWKALENNKPDEAINYVRECVNRYESEAIKQRETLTEPPPVGAVTPEQKTEIFSNWALNDVGTAYFIMGQAYEKSAKTHEAQEAYQKAMEFPYARTWDPNGWFWSPAEAAKERIDRMP